MVCSWVACKVVLKVGDCDASLPIQPFFQWPKQGRNVVRCGPGQEASLVLPCSNLSFFGSKCTVLKKVHVTLLGLFGASPPQWFGATRAIAHPLPSLVTPLDRRKLRQIRPQPHLILLWDKGQKCLIEKENAATAFKARSCFMKQMFHFPFCAGTLLKLAEYLLKMGLSVPEVIEGYEQACEKAIEVLPGESRGASVFALCVSNAYCRLLHLLVRLW